MTEPNIEWYLGASQARGVQPRCPFATVDRCPRYWASLSLLKHMGHTSLSDEEERRLEKKWAQSDLLPKIAEHDTSISGGSCSRCLSNYCPEVSYESYSLFASLLCEHGDEIDRDMAYRRLSAEKTPRESWKWQWAACTPMHYTECPRYSPLLHSATTAPKGAEGKILNLKPTFMGMSIDINQIAERYWPRLHKWLKSRGS